VIPLGALLKNIVALLVSAWIEMTYAQLRWAIARRRTPCECVD